MRITDVEVRRVNYPGESYGKPFGILITIGDRRRPMDFTAALCMPLNARQRKMVEAARREAGC
jgi:hypothetical protein